MRAWLLLLGVLMFGCYDRHSSRRVAIYGGLTVVGGGAMIGYAYAADTQRSSGDLPPDLALLGGLVGVTGVCVAVGGLVSMALSAD